MPKKPTYEELEKRIQEFEQSEPERKRVEEALWESESKYRDIIENIEDAYYEVDTAGNFTFFNKSMCRILGYAADELMGKNNREYMDEESAKNIFQVFHDVYKTGIATKALDWKLIKKDGSECFVETLISLVMDSNNKKVGFRGVARNITDRKQAEDALRKSEERYRLHFENVLDIIYTIDPEFKFLDVSPSVEKLLGYKAKELIGRPFQDLNVLAPEYLEQAFSDCMRILNGERIISTVYQFIDRDGTKKWGEISGAPVIRDNQVVAITCVARDITERKQAAAKLAESEDKYRSLFNQSTEGIYLHDFEGRILDVNEKACEQSGYSREEWLGVTVFDGHPTQSRMNLPKTEILQAWSQWVPGQRATFEADHQRKDGTVYPVEISTGIVRYGDSNAVLAIVKDITERKLVEEALRKSEDRYRTLVENAKDIVMKTDGTGHITFVNQAAAHIMGYEEKAIIGRNYLAFCRPEIHEEILKLFGGQFAKKIPNTYSEYPIIAKDGREIWLGQNTQLIIEDNQVTGFQSVARDITEIKQAQAERDELVINLQKALLEIKKLSGLLPICSHCKNIRDDKGYWNKIESYIHKHSDAEFSHSICPECAKKLYPNMDLYGD